MAETTIGRNRFEIDDELFERFHRESNGMEGHLTDEAQLKLLAVCQDDFERLELFKYCRAWMNMRAASLRLVAEACPFKMRMQQISSSVSLSHKPLSLPR